MEDIGVCIISTTKIMCSPSSSVCSLQESGPSVERQGMMSFEIPEFEPFLTCWYHFLMINQFVTGATLLVLCSIILCFDFYILGIHLCH